MLRLVLGVCLVGICAAHVRLTFPPARTFALDFLDNVRTTGPCGMESTEDGPVTTFAPGDVINVTWHLAYSHRGGYRIEVINRDDGEVQATLTEGTDFVSQNDTTAWQQEVTIPSTPGAYSLRLTRQAAEWRTGNPDVPYLFRSCADINITTSASCNGGGCSGHGTCTNNQCVCDALFSGEFCQYEDECINEENCGGASNGECVDLGITTFPRRQCFCKPGYFGKDCMNMNPADFSDAENYDLSKHFRREVNDRFILYYKVVGTDEIEIAIDAMSTTWVGFGWRPLTLTGNCQNWPVHYNNGSAISEPESEAEATAEPPAGRRRRRSSDEVRVRVARDNHEDDDEQEWQCTVGTGPVPEGEPEPAGSSEPAAEGTPEPGAEPTAEGAAEPEPSGEPEGEPEPTGEPEGEPEPGSNLHPMDCMDLTIGMVSHGNLTRIHDYYTRDRSTPRLDSFYGGVDNLVAAMGVQWNNGWTRVIFRKKLESTEITDHSIVNDAPMMTIWARGQEFGRYVHNPPSGLEFCQANDYMFYRRDELKYHGTSGDQRGLIPNLNFYQDSNAPRMEGPCMTEETVVGTNCNGPRCDMRVTIEFMADTDSYDVTLNTPIRTDQWTAIGFSENGAMIGSDAILVWVNGADGMIQVKDYQLDGKTFSAVVEDTNSNGLTVQEMTYQGGVLNVRFNRLRNTGDSNDFVFTNEESGCAMLLLPTPGAGFGSVVNGMPRQHGQTPMVTTRTCIRACSAGTRLVSSNLSLLITMIGVFYYTLFSKLF